VRAHLGALGESPPLAPPLARSLPRTGSPLRTTDPGQRHRRGAIHVELPAPPATRAEPQAPAQATFYGCYFCKQLKHNRRKTGTFIHPASRPQLDLKNTAKLPCRRFHGLCAGDPGRSPHRITERSGLEGTSPSPTSPSPAPRPRHATQTRAAGQGHERASGKGASAIARSRQPAGPATRSPPKRRHLSQGILV